MQFYLLDNEIILIAEINLGSAKVQSRFNLVLGDVAANSRLYGF